MEDKPIKLYLDCPSWSEAPKPDDFMVAIGKRQSNSVYHISKVRGIPRSNKRTIRYYLQCYRSDLLTCLKRDPEQALITIFWYSRNKKKNNEQR